MIGPTFPTPSARAMIGAAFPCSPVGAMIAAAAPVSGGCMTSWIEADFSPQKSSGRTGVVPSASMTPAPDARGPKGTSSSRGPNQSRGKRTTLSAASPGPLLSSLCGPSDSKRLQIFFGGRDDPVLLLR